MCALQDMTNASALHPTDFKAPFSPSLSRLSTKAVAEFPLFAPATKEGNIISPTESPLNVPNEHQLRHMEGSQECWRQNHGRPGAGCNGSC